MPNPSQDIKTISHWHFNVQKHQGGQRVFLTVAVGRISAQISYAFNAVREALNRMLQASPLESSFDQENVIPVVIDNKNQWQVLVCFRQTGRLFRKQAGNNMG